MAELTAIGQGRLNLAVKNDAKRSLQREVRDRREREMQSCHKCLFYLIVLGCRAFSRVRSPSSVKGV